MKILSSSLILIIFTINIYAQSSVDSKEEPLWLTVLAKLPWGNDLEQQNIVVFKNKIWSLGGYYSIGSSYDYIWCSSDGTEWKKMGQTDSPVADRIGFSFVVFKEKIWIIGGRSSDNQGAWYSSDGLKWTPIISNAQCLNRYNHASVVFDNKIWIIGGKKDNELLNDVWYSEDGKSWFKAISNAPWEKMTEPSSVVFQDKLWIIGGNYDYPHIWNSSNGVDWESTTRGPFQKGAYLRHTSSVVFQNKIWILDGSIPDKIWYSDDGFNWKQSSYKSPTYNKGHQNSVVFKDNIWFFDGNSIVKSFYPNNRADAFSWIQKTLRLQVASKRVFSNLTNTQAMEGLIVNIFRYGFSDDSLLILFKNSLKCGDEIKKDDDEKHSFARKIVNILMKYHKEDYIDILLSTIRLTPQDELDVRLMNKLKLSSLLQMKKNISIEPYTIGKILVMDIYDGYDDIDNIDHMGLFRYSDKINDSCFTLNYEEAKTIALIKDGREEVGWYGGNKMYPGFVNTCDLTIIDMTAHAIVYEKKIYGSAPPNQAYVGTIAYGDNPAMKVIEFLKSVRKK